MYQQENMTHISCITQNEMAQCLKAASYPNLPIIVVGSGNGTVEYNLRHKYGVQNMILIDPAPESFDSYPNNNEYLVPDYSTVEECLTKQPELKHNCIIFLPWSTPNDSTYDIDAINLLQPKGIVILFELVGAAGGIALHCWLNVLCIVNNFKYKWNDYNLLVKKWQHLFPKQKFSKVAIRTSTRWRLFRDTYHPLYYSLLWIVADGTWINKNLKDNIIKTFSINEDNV